MRQIISLNSKKDISNNHKLLAISVISSMAFLFAAGGPTQSSQSMTEEVGCVHKHIHLLSLFLFLSK